jgi:hypothetical protein
MKSKKIKRKLKLNRMTIANLQNMSNIMAGDTTLTETIEHPPCETVTSLDRKCYTELDCTAEFCPSYDLTGCCTTVSLCGC